MSLTSTDMIKLRPIVHQQSDNLVILISDVYAADKNRTERNETTISIPSGFESFEHTFVILLATYIRVTQIGDFYTYIFFYFHIEF